MTLQQLKYAVTTAESGSITKAAKLLYVSQPSLSGAIIELEKELRFAVFTRSKSGIALTQEGMEFIGYARQVIQQMELLESKYVNNQPVKQRLCISTQHYTFTTNAFVEIVKAYGQERFEFILNETQTHQIIENVKNRFSDMGILYLSRSNEKILRKIFKEYGLSFTELFSATPHIFVQKNHPLTQKSNITLSDLRPYPRLSFVQGAYESANFAEELFGNCPAEKNIKVSDRAACINFIIGLNGYTISSGIFPKYLQSKEIVSLPLQEAELMRIGYIVIKDKPLSELETSYVKALETFRPQI